jgi:biopolymer transport protein ExbB/TolQ
VFRHFLEVGGPLMWPLLVCSILLGGVLIERFLVVVVGWKLFRARSAALDWHRRILPFFADVPPSLGLLGTVVGVVKSFHLMNGHLNTESVGAGLGIACMTTIFGLGIAIVASVSGYVLNGLIADAAVEEGTRC